ncbi:MAG: mannosyltransferase OCH1-like enzyme [Candidatus Azotimanducaceae bacterium]|jgi:mannosyltransferase OCH1-like enzyme
MFKIPKFKMGVVIPRVIHQTYPVKEKLPAVLAENINNTRALNPNWKYCLYDNDDRENFILQYYGTEVLDCYCKIDSSYGAARTDLFRYLLIYAVGGVYLDIKAAVSKPFEKVILPSDHFILSKWDQCTHPGWGFHPDLSGMPGGEYQQWHIISVAGHPYLKVVIEKVLENVERYNPFRHGVGRKGVLKLSGPIAYSKAIEGIKSSGEAREVDICADFGIEYSLYKKGIDSQEMHMHLFKKHYTKLKTPVISTNIFFSSCVIFLYSLVSVMKKLVK